jgi:hypothetical protein
MAARVRERALANTRNQVNMLMQELAADRAELRFRDARIADLETQLEVCRQQQTQVVARAVARNRALKMKKPPARARISVASNTPSRPKKRSQSKRPPSVVGAAALFPMPLRDE